MTNYNINFLCYTDVSLNNIDSSGVGFVRYSSSDVIVDGAITKYAYRLHDNTNGPPNGTGYANHEICFIVGTSAWDDLGTGEPVDVDHVPNTNVIKITYGGGTLKYFANPFASTGSGAGTLSNSGSLHKEGSNLRWTVSSLSQDGTYTVTESSDGGDSYSINLNVVIPNVSGLRTGLLTNFDSSNMYIFYDPLENLIGSYVPNTKKKVYSNFW